MKKLLYILSLSLLISCGEEDTSVETIVASKDVTSIRAKKKELSEKQQEIIAQIKQLDAAIDQLDPNKKLPLVTSLTVKETLFNHYIDLQGSLQTKENLVLTPEFNGLLTSVLVKEGQYVTKGQTLARIDDGGLGQQLAQLEINAELAKTTFERQERLWEQKIGTEMQYLQAKANYEAQNKAVSQLKSNLAKTVIKAPFSGVIDDIITEQGNVVGAGASPILRIVNLNNMYVEVNVPERYIATVKKGAEVIVDVPVLGKSIPTVVKSASSTINAANRTYAAEVAVPNKAKDLKPNLTAKLKIKDYTSAKALLIPQSLISENANGDQYVYTLGKNDQGETIALQQTITTGKSQGSVVEVLSGLKSGDQLIEEGARSVRNEQTVKVLN